MGRLAGVHIYRGWWIVFTGYLAQLSTAGASGWVFGVLILPMQDELGWSRSTIVGVLTLERLVTGAAAPLLAAFAFDQTGSYVATFVFFGVCCLGSSAGFLFSNPRRPKATLQAVQTT